MAAWAWAAGPGDGNGRLQQRKNNEQNENTGPKLTQLYTKKAEHPSRVKTGSREDVRVSPRAPWASNDADFRHL